ncbi:MAG TPA: prepilin-type N-terminal cleavage/methylation domain-containing protein [Nitrospirota bacterium]|nr:prepilin-type N-terminal cleavage/methylation domain-containing protein [Nitrospirota bacterium]
MMKIRKENGISLVELMVVISIVAILVGFTSVGRDVIRRGQVMGAAKQLLADLQHARMDAMTQDSRGFGIRFASSKSYAVFQFNDCNNDFNYDAGTCPGGTREEANPVLRTLPGTVILNKSDLKTDISNEVRIFDRFGRSRQETGGVGGITVIVSDSATPGMVHCIKISASRVIEGRWNGGECTM